jgi:thiamine pyrophosphokinase
MGFPLDKLDFISGDFDSHSGSDENIYQENLSIRRIRIIQIFIKHWILLLRKEGKC